MVSSLYALLRNRDKVKDFLMTFCNIDVALRYQSRSFQENYMLSDRIQQRDFSEGLTFL